MDCYRSSSSPAGKIRLCASGKRMSSLKFDFHTVCSDCRGLDCDLEMCCIECADISDVAMSEYVSHKFSLKCKHLAKRKFKAPLPPSVVVHEPVVVAGDQPLAKPASPCVSPVLVTSASDAVAKNQSDIVSQVTSMFASFTESLEARFSSVDQRFSLVISSSASNSHSRVDFSCQDAISNRSFAAPAPVAVHFEHPPDRAPSVAYSDDLGTALGGRPL